MGAIRNQFGVNNFSHHWFLIFGLVMGMFVTLPFLAPIFMSLGWDSAGKMLYLVYSFACHQLPQRSYFLFGSSISYSLSEIQASWIKTIDPLVLRQFVGNPVMGWKVAWSDRMVSMYTSLWLAALLWWRVRQHIKPLKWTGFVLFLLPMALDGSTHMLSDLYGIGQGFRDSNAWLATISGHFLSPDFYRGDAWGSFNAWMRLISGILFGIGLVWFAFPLLENAFSQPARQPEDKASISSTL